MEKVTMMANGSTMNSAEHQNDTINSLLTTYCDTAKKCLMLISLKRTVTFQHSYKRGTCHTR